MRLSQKTVVALITLMIVALSGLVYLQYRLLKNTVDLKEQTFRQNIFAALNYASEKLEEIDVRDRAFLTDSVGRFNVKLFTNDQVRNLRDSARTVSIVTTSQTGLSTTLEGERLTYSLDKPKRISVQVFDVLGRLDSTFVDELKPSGKHALVLPGQRMAGGTYFVRVKTDSAASMFRWDGNKQATGYVVGGQNARKEKILKRVMEAVTPEKIVPFSQRLTEAILDSVVSQGLHQNGIAILFKCAVVDLLEDSVLVGKTPLASLKAVRNSFSVPVFPSDFASGPAKLIATFPTYDAFLVSEYLPELASILAMVGAIIFCFGYTIRTILRQKEFAVRLTDFINTMTHEFKTPISTIALANEAMIRPEVVRSNTKLRRYNKVIGDENRRMRNQVEKILQMATLEEGEHEFNKVRLDLHEIIQKAVDNIEVQIEARKGNVKVVLNAQQSVVQGDAVHIENVIYNLLDNANKYSANKPNISVSTLNVGGSLVVVVADRGLGIAREHIDKVFDKYYRVPTGNLHDVKGFGLGLSYVKLILEAHGGLVAIKSEPGKGTMVELRFPQ